MNPSVTDRHCRDRGALDSTAQQFSIYGYAKTHAYYKWYLLTHEHTARAEQKGNREQGNRGTGGQIQNEQQLAIYIAGMSVKVENLDEGGRGEGEGEER
jgi:hypothetical protein